MYGYCYCRSTDRDPAQVFFMPALFLDAVFM
jgi:hypothetical protein